MKNLNKGLTIVAAALLSTGLMAAQDGAIDRGSDNSISSTGNFDVTLKVKHAIQVNRLNDIALADFESGITTGLSGVEEFCVFTNSASFNLTISGGQAAGFELVETNDSSLTIPYTVELATQDTSYNATAYQTVTHNQPIAGISEVRNRKDCSVINPGSGTGTNTNIDNMIVKVSVADNDALDAVPGDYKDTITVVASPE
tara:strand:- start:877 stop:1476 length:600 start_codon:yes stop_codon:yes gene_type:complete